MHPSPVLATPAAYNPASLIALSTSAVEALADFRRALDDLHDQCVREVNFRPEAQFLRDLQDAVQRFALRMPNNLDLALIRDTIVQLAHPLQPQEKGSTRV